MISIIGKIFESSFFSKFIWSDMLHVFSTNQIKFMARQQTLRDGGSTSY